MKKNKHSKKENRQVRPSGMSRAEANLRRKRMAAILGTGSAPARRSVPAPAAGNGSAIIFQSELDYLSDCILEYPDIETGGQLFGYWTSDGVPVVVYAIGPGPGANHQKTFFNQDVDYLVRVGGQLRSRYGLHHIGEWHSHHRLGLARPSGHDAHTMNSTIREKGLGRFLLCIGNISGARMDVSVGAFLCDGIECRPTGWTAIAADSPVRVIADRELGQFLVHPRRTPAAGNAVRSSRPAYAPGYWLTEKGSGAVLNDIINYLKGRNRGVDVRVQLNAAGEVQLTLEHGRYAETILFPLGFPVKAPVIERFRDGRREAQTTSARWESAGDDILHSVILYYENY